MIENIEQAKEKLKSIVDFYKLNDENNYDYSDRVLISMKLVLEEIERLNNIIDKAIEYIDWQRRNPQYDNVWRNAECEDLIEILRGDKE